ncbi:BA14K family protein, partial [Mesorhizobium sp.]
PPPPPAARLAAAHVRWCFDRYRSYRAWDNSYQPYGGPRQQCLSPYS